MYFLRYIPLPVNENESIDDLFLFFERSNKFCRTHTGNIVYLVVSGITGNNAINTFLFGNHILNSIFKVFPAESQSIGDGGFIDRMGDVV